MTRGIYAAAGGMLVGSTRQEILSNNLANVSTPGFKTEQVSYGSFQRVLLDGVTDETGAAAAISQSSTVNATRCDLRSGSLLETSGKLDLAVQGDGWFVVGTPNGERYTRNGHFTRAPDGTLVTSTGGYPLLGQSGPIRLPSDTVQISDAGDIRSGTQVLGRLRLVRLTDATQVVRSGENLLSGGAPQADMTSQVRQGWLEQSNADPMRSMVEMMQTMRSFEMNQRIIQAQDQTLQQTLDIARH